MYTESNYTVVSYVRLEEEAKSGNLQISFKSLPPTTAAAAAAAALVVLHETKKGVSPTLHSTALEPFDPFTKQSSMDVFAPSPCTRNHS